MATNGKRSSSAMGGEEGPPAKQHKLLAPREDFLDPSSTAAENKPVDKRVHFAPSPNGLPNVTATVKHLVTPFQQHIPPQPLMSTSSASAPSDSQGVKPPKKKRGRPRKNPEEPSQERLSQESTDDHRSLVSQEMGAAAHDMISPQKPITKARRNGTTEHGTPSVVSFSSAETWRQPGSANDLFLRGLIKQSADFLRANSNELDARQKACEESAQAARIAEVAAQSAQEQVDALTLENERLKSAIEQQATRLEAVSAENARLCSIVKQQGARLEQVEEFMDSLKAPKTL